MDRHGLRPRDDEEAGIKRLLHLASFALSSLPVMLRQVLWRPQVVWVG